MHLGKRSRKMERHGNTRLRTPLKGTLFEKLSQKCLISLSKASECNSKHCDRATAKWYSGLTLANFS